MTFIPLSTGQCTTVSVLRATLASPNLHYHQIQYTSLATVFGYLDP